VGNFVNPIPRMGEVDRLESGQPVGVRATGQTRLTRTFWWDREPPAEADVLRAVIFDADSALADIERDGDMAARDGLVDLVMSLFVAGIWVGVVSTRRRAWVETLVRQLIGEGLVETIVTVDDLPDSDAEPQCDAELYRLALWELGITHRNALAVTGSGGGLRAAVAAELPTLVVPAGYDGDDPLRATGCRQAHRRWWIGQQRSRVA
jgi:beta-phosphoglucomutase-like phosphatase (HAD superfamily)